MLIKLQEMSAGKMSNNNSTPIPPPNNTAKPDIPRITVQLSSLSGAPLNLDIMSIDVGSYKHFDLILAQEPREYIGIRFSSAEKHLVLFPMKGGIASINEGRSDDACGTLPAITLERTPLVEIAHILISGVSKQQTGSGKSSLVSSAEKVPSSGAGIYRQVFEDAATNGNFFLVHLLIQISSVEQSTQCAVLLPLDMVNANFRETLFSLMIQNTKGLLGSNDGG